MDGMRRSIQNLPMDTAAVPGGSGMKHKVAKLMHAHDGVAALSPTAPVMLSGGSIEQEVGISTETCKSQLGERTFNILRQAMLQQQETFIEQLWDLHKLTRAQHRKAALLPANPYVAEKQVDHAIDVFSRDVQEHQRTLTMRSILQLPTMPASLRRSVLANDAAQKDVCQRGAVTCASGRIPTSRTVAKAPAMSPEQSHIVSAPASTRPLFPAGLNGEVAYQYPHMPGQGGFCFADMGPRNAIAWASANPHLAGSDFSNTLAMHGQPPVCASQNPQYLAGVHPEPYLSRTILFS